MKQPGGGRWGTFLVALGASFWASDLILRRGLAQELPAIEIVFWEHLILTVACVPLLLRARPYLRAFGSREWVAAILVGAGASVAATILFTAAFARGDATSVLLLQKLQPLVVVLAAHLVLGERLTPRYLFFAIPALAGGYMLTFPDPFDVRVEQLTAAALSVGAAVLWGLGTVLGRQLSFKIPHLEQAALRFTIGLPVAALLLGLAARTGPATIARASDGPTLIALALIPGLLAMSLYYAGLRRTPAVTATLAELAFPLTAVVLSYTVFDAQLQTGQWIGLAILMLSITALGIEGRRGPEAVGVRQGRPLLGRELEPEPVAGR